ncbi:precorrin-4/cobalt-precorrin-4 C11-methyltransferase [Meinhardsimonia xiamenensis]|uniref:Precorrin-4/cobalt-precorrin-4 C11-methyltransferase n=1 Tax=Meinhardsimonia xiamenensis TaxID=990712 RepID=A0A1G8XQK0_9RHOB|nr:precorrin-4 C(11)-methyltransferase [Meinhardsimonia xiamenensis]PRX37003.1 precorrin-4/cobalt-precorrin-4 C11-methyltransferase [Meinhardsimonia xiamenensis]SDJ92753.1 precorrin-4/cobalt-precorrin-4 C11-methyltransferase [Meinhardsimonia xiamenensis]
MKVFFIGAGPGDPELLTQKAARLIAACPVCLYAGSLVPREVVALAPEGARVLDTASMTLDETHAEILAARERGEDVARVHSGDPSLYGAIAEQIRRLRADGIDYEIVPGVPAYAAAAAALGQELTIPELAQSIVLTRMSMKSTAMPEGERLENFARTGATLAIHLGIRALREIVRVLTPHYGEDCPVAVVYRASWPDQQIIRGTLADIHGKVRAAKITRTALILVGPALSESAEFPDSALYDPAHPHVLRPKVLGKPGR